MKPFERFRSKIFQNVKIRDILAKGFNDGL